MERTVAALLLGITTSALALDLEEAKSRVGLEYAYCSNWYLIMQEVAARSFPPGLDRNMAMAQQKELAQRAEERAARMTSPEIAAARIKESLETMKGRIKNSLENLPVIADDYAYSCKELLEHPDSRLQFWLEQK